MFNEGDIVEIPLPDGRTAIGWIILKSGTFKNAVGFVVFGLKGSSRLAEFSARNALDVFGPLYTNIAALSHYGWRAFGHQDITYEKRLLSRRLVGGTVYIGDEHIGTPSSDDEAQLREMEVMGMPVIYERIMAAFK